MPPKALVDLDNLDFDKPLYDLQEIRKVNPQRHDMEQLTGILMIDEEHQLIVGYKDVTMEEFWVTGHMPSFPMMPGVMLCECAAQLAGFYGRKFNVLGGDYLGFGGMDDVRFRRPVFPPCRLVIAAQMKEVRAGRRAKYEFQGYVDERMAFSGMMIGVPITRDQKVN